jgi:hypothetical protein
MSGSDPGADLATIERRLFGRAFVAAIVGGAVVGVIYSLVLAPAWFGFAAIFGACLGVPLGLIGGAAGSWICSRLLVPRRSPAVAYSLVATSAVLITGLYLGVLFREPLPVSLGCLAAAAATPWLIGWYILPPPPGAGTSRRT